MAGTDEARWAEFYARKNVELVVAPSPTAGLRFAFYGRCSTEDNQDPATSRAWQLKAAQSLLGRDGGTVVEEFFDIGESRSLPWKRRTEAQRLLAALSNPKRGWDAVIVGEGQRCWFGNQFNDVAELIAHHKLTLWVPELGGEYDPSNSSHYMLLTLTGGMSRGERQRVQERTRLGMESQAEDGRFLGGRPPYGYTIEVLGRHPNKRKAEEGHKLKRLVADEAAAPVMREIFQMRLAGKPPADIARTLNTRGVPCPSAHDPLRNGHRPQSGWQSTTIRTLLQNPRFTGWEFWGKFEKRESLMVPDDPSWGHKTTLGRAEPEKLIRSRDRVHEALVSLDDFLRVQEMWTTTPDARNRPAGAAKAKTSPYALRGLIRCAYCGNAMEGARSGGTTLYRCRSYKKTPGAALDENHSKNISVSERIIVTTINAWLGNLFSPQYRQNTVDRLLVADVPANENRADIVTDKLALAEKQRANLQQVVMSLASAGGDLDAWMPQIQRNDGEIRDLKSELLAVQTAESDREPGVIELLAELDDEAQEAIAQQDPQILWNLYRAIGLQVRYSHHEHEAEVTVSPKTKTPNLPKQGGGKSSVRGGT
jgi:DNA invertase Pin-like site-specific DNA recombinase